jgi:hypothetical protein
MQSLEDSVMFSEFWRARSAVVLVAAVLSAKADWRSRLASYTEAAERK